MQISGHRTRSDRYDITTEKDALETGKKLEQHWRELAQQEAARETAADDEFATKRANDGQEDRTAPRIKPFN